GLFVGGGDAGLDGDAVVAFERVHIGFGEGLAPGGIGEAFAVGGAIEVGGFDEDFGGDFGVADDGGDIGLGAGALDFGADRVALIVALDAFCAEFIEQDG